MSPGVARAPDPGLAVRRVAAVAAADREDEDRVRLVRVDDDREAEVARAARRAMYVQVAALVVGAVDAAVVLQVEPLGRGGVPGHLVHALAELGVLLALGQELRPDALVARRPTSRRRRWSGRRRRSRSRRSPTSGRSGAAGSCGRPGRRSRRPTRAGAGGPRAPRSSAKVSPPSVGAPDRARARCRRRRRRPRRRAPAARPARPSRSTSSGNRIAPSGVSCQLSPRSSERRTCGPSQLDEAPASSRGRSPRVSIMQE